MTAPDTKAIRAQMEALAGHTMGPWHLCAHLANDDENGCSCGYRGVIYGPQREGYAVCQPGHEPAPEGQEGTEPPRYERSQEVRNARLIAAAPHMRATILALCDAYEYSRLAVAHANDHADTAISDMQELRDENERLLAIIDNLHAVEEKHRETANDQFHRANRLQAENERLLADREQGGKDYCNIMDQRDALHVYAKKLEAALRPFVEYVHDDFRRGKATYELVATDRAGGGLIGAEDLRRARAALAQKGGE